MKKFKYGEKDACTLCWPNGTPYECKACPKGTCPSNGCFAAGFNYAKDEYSPIHRGVCCRGRGYKDLCLSCEKWETKKVCVLMIGARKFRRGNLLNLLPRDVLIYALVKPFVWEERGKGDSFKNLKKLKTQ